MIYIHKAVSTIPPYPGDSHFQGNKYSIIREEKRQGRVAVKVPPQYISLGSQVYCIRACQGFFD
jgi:hypothetical protein